MARQDKTRKEIMDTLALHAIGWSGLYNSRAVNWTGVTKKTLPEDGGKKDTEVVAAWINKRFKQFSDGILQIERTDKKPNRIKGKPYLITNHEGTSASDRRPEEKIAQQLSVVKNSSDWDIGEIINYQIPLKENDEDCAGKIDLISKKGNELFILELKRPSSKETLLRCLLEGYTYYKTIKIKKSFKHSFDMDDAEFVICPLFFEGSQPDKDRQLEHTELMNLVKYIEDEVRVKFMRIEQYETEDPVTGERRMSPPSTWKICEVFL